MSVKSIQLFTETNPYDSVDDCEEPTRGSIYTLSRIYKIINDDGSEQYFKLTAELGSYGYAYANDISRKFDEVRPIEKTLTTFE